MLPERAIKNIVRGRGISDVIDYAKIQRQDGSLSTIVFKSFEQNVAKWASETIDLLWYDEEPPYQIYDEGQTRLNNGGNVDPDTGKNTGGISYITATPLLGMTDVIRLYYPEESSPKHRCIQMEIDEVEHYTEERKKEIVSAYAPWQREARAKGVPVLGSGRVFPVSEETIEIEPYTQIPPSWKQINGLDFGWDHPTAAARCYFDVEEDIFYVAQVYAEKEQVIPVHASALKRWGDAPWAWPHDGNKHDASHSGESMKDLYHQEGMRMLNVHAQLEGGGNSLEVSIQEMLTYMVTGRFKVFNTCRKFFDEFRLYHRKNGKIVSLVDDVLSAARYAFMMRRHARTSIQKNIPDHLEPYDPFNQGRKETHSQYWWPSKEGYTQ
jgi:phage terminase large subunit-like protein